MTSIDKLVDKLRKHGIKIPNDYEFRRNYPGYWQRSSGAWSWTIHWHGGEVGSSDPVKVILKSSAIHDGPYNEIFGD